MANAPHPRRGPMTMLDQMRDELDGLYRRFFGEAGGPPPADPAPGAAVWTPRVDVVETDRGTVVTADLPGVRPDDIDVAVHNGTLVIRGEKRADHEGATGVLRVERYVGPFFRAVPLPADADEGAVTAATALGVLTVSVPKKPGVQPRKISVQGA